MQPQKIIKAAVVVVTPVFLQVLVLGKWLDCFPLLLNGCSHLRNSLKRLESSKNVYILSAFHTDLTILKKAHLQIGVFATSS